MPTLTCKRHPSEETRLACSACGDAICPRCAVPSAVGQKCPACARQARGARGRGKPRQYVKAVAAGVGAGIVSASVLSLVFSVGWITLIASGLVGYGVARAVHWGAESNRAGVFVAAALILAVLAVEGAWLLQGVLLPQGYGLLTYLAGAFGAWLVYR